MTGEVQLNHIHAISIFKICTQNECYMAEQKKGYLISLSHFKRQNSLTYERGPVTVQLCTAHSTYTPLSTNLHSAPRMDKDAVINAPVQIKMFPPVECFYHV